MLCSPENVTRFAVATTQPTHPDVRALLSASQRGHAARATVARAMLRVSLAASLQDAERVITIALAAGSAEWHVVGSLCPAPATSPPTVFLCELECALPPDTMIPPVPTAVMQTHLDAVQAHVECLGTWRFQPLR